MQPSSRYIVPREYHIVPEWVLDTGRTRQEGHTSATGQHELQGVVTRDIVVPERGDRMASDEAIARRPARFMEVFELVRGGLVGTDEGGECQPKEWHGLALGAEGEPAEDGHADHQRVQRHVHSSGKGMLPRRRCGCNGGCRSQQADGQRSQTSTKTARPSI